MKGESKLTPDYTLAYLQAVKDVDDHKFVGFLQLLKDFRIRKISVQEFVSRARDLFRGHPRLICGLNTFLPPRFNIQVQSDEPHRPNKHNKEGQLMTVEFVNKIKTRFQDTPQVYLGFLQILNTYCKTMMSILDLYQEVSLLFISHPDLIHDFATFLPDPSFAPPSLLQGRYLVPTTLPSWGRMRRSDIKESKKRERKTDDLDRGKRFHKNNSSPALHNPSYTFSPQMPQSPTNDPDLQLAAQVLNNSYITSTSCTTSERYFRSDEYGEDDLFEMDMLEESVKAAKKSAEILLEKINNGTILPGSPFHIREHFTAQNLRCLGSFYRNGKWPLVMDSLREYPIRVLPVVLARLCQKAEELEQYRIDFHREFRAKMGNKSVGQQKKEECPPGLE